MRMIITSLIGEEFFERALWIGPVSYGSATSDAHLSFFIAECNLVIVSQLSAVGCRALNNLMIKHGFIEVPVFFFNHRSPNLLFIHGFDGFLYGEEKSKNFQVGI